MKCNRVKIWFSTDNQSIENLLGLKGFPIWGVELVNTKHNLFQAIVMLSGTLNQRRPLKTTSDWLRLLRIIISDSLMSEPEKKQNREPWRRVAGRREWGSPWGCPRTWWAAWSRGAASRRATGGTAGSGNSWRSPRGTARGPPPAATAPSPTTRPTVTAGKKKIARRRSPVPLAPTRFPSP